MKRTQVQIVHEASFRFAILILLFLFRGTFRSFEFHLLGAHFEELFRILHFLIFIYLIFHEVIVSVNTAIDFLELVLVSIRC